MIINISNQDFEKFRKGLKRSKSLSNRQFRKGECIENLIVAKYGDMIVLEEMANIAINDTYFASIIKENENTILTSS